MNDDSVFFADARSAFADLPQRLEGVLSCTVKHFKDDFGEFQCRYKSSWGVPAIFGLEIEKKQKNFNVTLHELPENTGQSVTNMVEFIATMVKHQFLHEIENEDIRWFDKFRDDPESEVIMLWDDVQYSRPEWKFHPRR